MTREELGLRRRIWMLELGSGGSEGDMVTGKEKNEKNQGIFWKKRYKNKKGSNCIVARKREGEK
jgi:hypothetical protein